jgi:hypothetical protein
MITVEDIEARKHRRPFVAIRVRTIRNESFDVVNPRTLMIGRRDILIGKPDWRNPDVYVQLSRVALADIMALEDLPVKKGKSNGNGRR